MEKLDILQDTVKDHETRIRSLEQDRIKMRVDLANINKSQSDIKLMLIESNNQVNNQLTKLINKFVDAEINVKKNGWNLTLKIWGAVSSILLIIAGYYFQK